MLRSWCAYPCTWYQRADAYGSVSIFGCFGCSPEKHARIEKVPKQQGGADTLEKPAVVWSWDKKCAVASMIKHLPGHQFSIHVRTVHAHCFEFFCHNFPNFPTFQSFTRLGLLENEESPRCKWRNLKNWQYWN